MQNGNQKPDHHTDIKQGGDLQHSSTTRGGSVVVLLTPGSVWNMIKDRVLSKSKIRIHWFSARIQFESMFLLQSYSNLLSWCNTWTVFDDFRRWKSSKIAQKWIFQRQILWKLHQNDNFKGRFPKKLTLSDSNPDFGFHGVEIFTRFEAGFE